MQDAAYLRSEEGISAGQDQLSVLGGRMRSKAQTPATAATVPGHGRSDQGIDVTHATARRQLVLAPDDIVAFEALLAEPNGNRLCFLPDDPGCVFWKGRTNSRGYGLAKVIGRRHPVPAHHVAWVIEHGSIPADSDLVADHLCQVPSCVSVLHLEWVSALENYRRIDGRSPVCRRGHPWHGLLPLYRTNSQIRVCFVCLTEGPTKPKEDRRRGFKTKASRVLRCPRGHDVTGDNGYDLPNLRGRRGCHICTSAWKATL